MATVVNMHQAKTELSRLVASALEGEEVIITRDGKPVAKLMPIREDRKPGMDKGKIWYAPDAFEPMSDDELNDWEPKLPE